MRCLPAVSALLVTGLACRANPIPEWERYPAGTPLVPRFVTVDSTRLQVIEAGRGPTVVLIHGLAASVYSWRYTMPALVQAGFHVVAFDNRGFGSSDKPAHGYSNADYVGLLLGLMDSLGVSDAVLVGHSMGGSIAAEAALAHPERVTGLVLVDPAGFGVRWPFMLRVARWPIVGSLFDRFRGRSATARILRMLYADPSRVTDQDVEQYYAPLADPGAGRALRGVLRHVPVRRAPTADRFHHGSHPVGVGRQRSTHPPRDRSGGGPRAPAWSVRSDPRGWACRS